jgi:hypothetical protein
VQRAIGWVIRYKGAMPPEYLLEGAIYAIRERMKLNRNLLDAELALLPNLLYDT